MNIIKVIITITFIFYWIDYFCKYETYSNEGVQNLNKVYNKKKLIINNLNIKNNLSINGELECYGNGTFENAKIGNWDSNNDFSVFSHKNRTGNNYGIIQNDKNTYVNSTEDSSVYIKNNNTTTKMTFNSNSIRFDDDNLGIEHKDLGYDFFNSNSCVDTGYPVDKWVCILADYRGYYNYNNRYFFQRKGSPNWWLSFCASYDPDKGTDPSKLTSGSDTCPHQADWKYVTITAIPRILYNKVEFIKTT